MHVNSLSSGGMLWVNLGFSSEASGGAHMLFSSL
jgi:hypothetical protein